MTITFAGQLASGPQPPISVTNSLTGGTTPAASIAHTTTGAIIPDVQTLSVSGTPTGGTFTLTFNNQTTAAIPFNATSAQVQAALTALSSIGPGNIVCTGGPLPSASVTITFAGQLASGPQPLIAAGGNSLTSATTPQPTIVHTTSGLGVASVVVPVDPDNAVIPNLGWDPARFVLIDTVSQASSVDTATLTLNYPTGQAFQHGTENAIMALGGFSTISATVTGTSPVWGVPLDVDGQPVPNLRMRPDVAPGGAFLDFAGNVLSLDGSALGVSNGGTGKPKAFVNGSVYYKVTFDICSLAKSINVALNNGALQVWGYGLDPAQPFDGTAAFADFMQPANQYRVPISGFEPRRHKCAANPR